MKTAHLAALEAFGPLLCQRRLRADLVLVVVVGGGHSGRRSDGFRNRLAAQFRREMFPSKGREHAVLDAGRQFLGPLRDRSGRNADGFSGGSDRPAEQFESACFFHKPQISTLTFQLQARLFNGRF